MIYAEPENARGRSSHGLLAYVLHDHGSSDTAARVSLLRTVNLLSPTIEAATDEMRATAVMALMGRRRGQRPDRMAFHFILSWHPEDRPTPEHMAETALDALVALGLAEHQAIIVGHGDTNAPHVHVIANAIHPDTGKAAKLGWRYRTMSRWAGGYEESNNCIRCPQRISSGQLRTLHIVETRSRVWPEAP